MRERVNGYEIPRKSSQGPGRDGRSAHARIGCLFTREDSTKDSGSRNKKGRVCPALSDFIRSQDPLIISLGKAGQSSFRDKNLGTLSQPSSCCLLSQTACQISRNISIQPNSLLRLVDPSITINSTKQNLSVWKACWYSGIFDIF